MVAQRVSAGFHPSMNTSPSRGDRTPSLPSSPLRSKTAPSSILMGGDRTIWQDCSASSNWQLYGHHWPTSFYLSRATQLNAKMANITKAMGTPDHVS